MEKYMIRLQNFAVRKKIITMPQRYLPWLSIIYVAYMLFERYPILVS